MTKPEVLRSEGKFYLWVRRRGFPVTTVKVLSTVLAMSATASFFRLFLVIFIKTSDVAKRNLAEVIFLAAKIVLTKYAALKFSIFR